MRILSLFLLLFLASCFSPPVKEVAKKNFEEYILKNMHDPESYEFVEMSKFDTLTYEGYCKEEIQILEIGLEGKDKAIDDLEEVVEIYKQLAKESREHKDGLIKAQRDYYSRIASYKKVEDKVDLFKEMMNSDTSHYIKYIKTNFKIRAKNKMGAKVLGSYRVRFDKSLKVILAAQGD